MNENEKQLLRRLGEDAAYTFKGLHKHADWLDQKYKLYLSLPIIFSIISIGFDEEMPALFLKLIAVIALVGSALALIDQKDFEKSSGYRELADYIKNLYDKVEAAYLLEDPAQYSVLSQEWLELRKQFKDYPIGKRAYKKTQKRIKQEMNLSWLGGEYC
ncbi:hypothetical protein ACKOZB_004644 [Vibrio parahaemolyticus]|uniref:hypothetical protein n=1 Tax=Vibrio natriegens TaxID=691 RepID=UPI001DD13470|nr:hypothetical protein [Vibrio natriegens]EGR0930945.1 hypothetical protein [Vibrio parahaemolyticus]EIZ1340476.1 hypothetical protein [Vibrio parahaemolyticus]MCG9699392.1 hypothetical protein [Vibrio natriegens]